MTTMAQLGLPAQAQVNEGLVSCGQPSLEQLEAARRAGVRTVINLRPHAELPWDERRIVEGLGMRYATLPVAGGADITPARAEALHRLLADEAVLPALLHCGTGNRAGALWAAKRFHCEGYALEAAIAEGRRAGLTGLEAELRQRLGAARGPN